MPTSLHAYVRPLLIAAFSVLALASCRLGNKPSEIDWVTSPNGARVALRVQGETADRIGELLTADSDGVVVRGPTIVRVAWSRVLAIDVDQLGGNYDLLRGEKVTDDIRRRLALVSRFPQGMTPELLTQLLTLGKQTELQVIK